MTMGLDGFLNGDEFGTVLTGGFGNHVNTKSIKEIAKEIGYPISFFKPRQKVILLYELTFIHVAIVIHAVNLKKDTQEAKIIIDSFLDKMRPSLNSMSEGEPEFEKQYSSRLSSYFEILGDEEQSPHMLIGLSTQFLRYISNGERELANPKNMTFIGQRLGTFLKETTYILGTVELN